MMHYGIGLDTGGTYTDIVLFDLEKRKICRKAKVPTTHHDYRLCLEEAVENLKLTSDEAKKVARVGLSTTLATNAIAENKLGEAGLFLESADIRLHEPVHKVQTLLTSCMDYIGYEIKPVSKDEVLRAADKMVDHVQAFAVSTYAATRNCSHEDQIADILREHYDKPVVKAYELSHQFNFIQRAHAAVLNAGLLSSMKPWQKELCEVFRKINSELTIYIVSGDGSLMTLEEAEQSPVKTILSGPASSLLGGAFLSGSDSAYVVDVGGTTLDIGSIDSGQADLCKGAAKVQGKRLAIDTLNVTAYGLGGDSRLVRGKHGLEFSNERVIPYARCEHENGIQFNEIEKELEFRWMMRDIEWLECYSLNEEVVEENLPKSLSFLKEGPWPWRMISHTGDDGEKIDQLLKSKVLQRMTFTPTDLACVMDWKMPYGVMTSKLALKLYAKMIDVKEDVLIQLLETQLHRQVLAILLHHFCDLDQKNELAYDHEKSILECLKTSEDSKGQTKLALDAGKPVMVLGAAGPMFFANMPDSIQKRLEFPEDGDVANAIGAICAKFVFRDEGVIELKRYQGADVVLHHGRESFDTLEEAEFYIKNQLEQTLKKKANDHALNHIRFDLQKEEVEVPLDFNKGYRIDEIRFYARLEGEPPKA